MFDDLKIICWPDPRLRRPSRPVEVFDQSLTELARRMFQLMRQSKGVGLAAPQVGLNIRMFVINPTGQDSDARVYVNPVLSEPHGQEEGEEGCLSLPGVNVKIVRYASVRLTAQDVNGNPIDQTASGYIARVWQHEFDHLNGTLLTDRMGAAARMAYRRTLRELQERYAAEHLRSTTRKGSPPSLAKR